MSVYKELGFVVREIESKSKQIYPDACDYGLLIKSFDDPIVKTINYLQTIYNPIKKIIKYSTGKTQRLIFKGSGMKEEIGLDEVIISYITISGKGGLGYIEVNYK